MSDHTDADGLSIAMIGCSVTMSVLRPSTSWPPRFGVSVAIGRALGVGAASLQEVASSKIARTAARASRTLPLMT
jgi:hypothetical protein